MICSSKFFNCKEIPQIELTEDVLCALADENVSHKLTVPGVQKKLSVHLSRDAKPRLTIVGYPAGYIIKPQSSEYECLPELEDMTMDIARAMGLKTVPHGLIKSNNQWIYITKRIDRIEDKFGDIKCLAMEDFCQLGERASEDKYKSSYEKCANIISRYSGRPGIDMTEYYLRLIVCFLTGNSDMHLKNFSLIESFPGSRNFSLSPAYDLLPVNLVVPEDKDETALTICGKRSNINRKVFITFAESCGISEKVAGRLIDSCLKKVDVAKEICSRSCVNADLQKQFVELIAARAMRLSNDLIEK